MRVLSSPRPTLRPTPRAANRGAGALGAVGTTGLAVLALVVVWQIASAWWVQNVLFPTPAQTLAAWWALLREGTLLVDVRVSLGRIAVGFVVGCLVGVPLGLAMGLFRPARFVFEPYVQFLRFVPAIAWLIPAIMWFGIGETSKVFLIVYTTIFLVVLSTMAGVGSIRRNYLRAAHSFGVSRWQLFAWVVVPATMPHILTGMRIAMGNSFAAVVGAELIAADSGLGFLILDSRQWLAADRMFAGMLTLGVLGVLVDRLFYWATAYLARRYLTP